jgi:hypothetical protein
MPKELVETQVGSLFTNCRIYPPVPAGRRVQRVLELTTIRSPLAMTAEESVSEWVTDRISCGSGRGGGGPGQLAARDHQDLAVVADVELAQGIVRRGIDQGLVGDGIEAEAAAGQRKGA